MKGQKLVLWLLAGSGVILLYSAYHNVSPTSLLAHYAGLVDSVAPLTSSTSASPMQGRPDNNSPNGQDNTGGEGFNPHGQQYANPGTISYDPYSGQYAQYNTDGAEVGLLPTGYQGSVATFIATGGQNV